MRSGRAGGIYRLSEDPDHRFALYASAGAPGKESRRRTITRPGRSSPASMAPSATSSMSASTTAAAPAKAGCAKRRREDAAQRRRHLLPARRLPSHRDAGRLRRRAALHFYGLSLEHLPDRVSVDMANGAAKRFMAKAKILDAAAVGPAGQGDAEVGARCAFFDVREEGEFSTGPSAVRHAAAAVAARAAIARSAARSRHRIVLMDSGERRAAPTAPRQAWRDGLLPISRS